MQRVYASQRHCSIVARELTTHGGFLRGRRRRPMQTVAVSDFWLFGCFWSAGAVVRFAFPCGALLRLLVDVSDDANCETLASTVFFNCVDLNKTQPRFDFNSVAQLAGRQLNTISIVNTSAMLGPWAVPGGTNADGDKSEIHSRPLDNEANRKSARHVVHLYHTWRCSTHAPPWCCLPK